MNGKFGPDFPGTHFLGDLLQLSFASSQRDLFEEGWMEFVTRVYWLKARFLALQVCFTFDLTNKTFPKLKLILFRDAIADLGISVHLSMWIKSAQTIVI